MNILITGGAGFIGSTLCEYLLKRGDRVICYDNLDDFYAKDIKLSNIASLRENQFFNFIEGDILDRERLTKLFSDYTIDLVVHLAAKTGVRPSIEKPKVYIDVNIVGTHTILEIMQKFGCKNLIFASSSSVYGNNKKIPFSEMDNVDFPISPYAATKKSCELLTYTAHNLDKINVINFRFFTVYGPKQRPDLAIHKFFNQLYLKQAVDIYGDGNTGRDYTYVDDIVHGISKGIDYMFHGKKPMYQTFNLGNHSPVKLMDLLVAIEKVTNKTFKRNYLPMQAGDVDFTYADISKAKQILGYEPKTELLDGLQKFKEWFENKPKQ